MNQLNQLKSFDPQIFECLEKEAQRQQIQVNLIASENYVSPTVHFSSMNALTNKYAEGYPHKRYYGGCEFADVAEDLAIERACQLFNADYANVQPHCGSQANQGIFHGVLNPGDTILGMDLNHGGHLTHGAHVNFSGRVYRAATYGVNDKGRIDYDQLRDIAKKEQPKMLIGGFSAYTGTLDWDLFRSIADEVGAYFLADIAHVAGLVATGVYPNPIEQADFLSTTTHKSLRGPRGGLIVAKRNPDLFKKVNFGIFPGVQGGPMMHTIAAKAVAFKEALTPEFKTYQLQVVANAKAMVEVFMERGIGVVGNGTDNHLVLLDLSNTEWTGKAAQDELESIGIVTNKNTIPNDKQSPFVTSGIRIGTPAMTTRGMNEDEARLIANMIADLIFKTKEKDVLAKTVKELAIAHPINTQYLV